jgi:hypothetical protein
MHREVVVCTAETLGAALCWAESVWTVGVGSGGVRLHPTKAAQLSQLRTTKRPSALRS